MGDRRVVSADEFRATTERLSNWGRWGTDDQLGTINLIRPETVLAAAAEVVTGTVFSLALPLSSSGPHNGGFGRFNPIHLMIRDGGDAVSGAFLEFSGGVDRELRGADDVIIMPLQAGTHWDALSHIMHGERLYNGHHAREVTSTGAKVHDITQVSARVVSRGVLLDVPRLTGREWLEPGEPITSDDLSRACESQGVEVAQGDIVLVRTGQLAAVSSRSSWADYAGGPAPGLSFESIAWFAERDVAAVATDTFAAEVRPNETPDIAQPFHLVGIVYMGLLIGEMFDLDTLAADCAVDGRYSFLFVAPPLPFDGAVGAPTNPIAIK